MSIFLLQWSKDWRCLCYANASQYIEQRSPTWGMWSRLQLQYYFSGEAGDDSLSASVCCSTHTIQSHPKTLDQTDKLSCYSFNALQFYCKCLVQGVIQSLTNVAY